MFKVLITSLLLFIGFNAFSRDTSLVHKNIIGIDFVPFEGNNYNIYGGAFDLKYIRKLHKRADILTTLGISYPVFPFGTINDVEGRYNFASVFGRFTLVPCYVPLRRNNKTIEVGAGYIAEMHNKRSQISLNGITTQFNFFNESKKRRFIVGCNIYMNVLFSSRYKEQTFFGGGFGLFLGGFTGKKPQSK